MFCCHHQRKRFLHPVFRELNLSNDDDDHNHDFKKTIGLMIKTTALRLYQSRFLVRFFDVHCTTTT